MTIVDNLEKAAIRLQSIFDSGLSTPRKDVVVQEYRDALIDANEALQDLYNAVESAYHLLEGYHKEDESFLNQLKIDLFGSRENMRPHVFIHPSKSDDLVYEFKEKYIPSGGIFTVMELLSRSMGLEHNSAIYAIYVRSAYLAYQQTRGAIRRLESRLSYTVMYPDSISKDALQVREYLKQQGEDNIWQQFNMGLDNFRQGDFLGSANRLTNALTSLILVAAQKYGYKGGQIGEHTIFLEKIGFIHDYIRQMISNYFGYLSKFRKGVEPTIEEARFFLDLAFSLFGFIGPRMGSFKVAEEKARESSKSTKNLVRMRKDEVAKKMLTKKG